MHKTTQNVETEVV